MSERKVLNKYYPPDYDPSLIPRLKRAKDRQYVIRVMAPFNMRCKTCGNYIYKGTKFNARMETVQDKNYLGLRIYRFYIKCTKCVAEITFLTDPENYDYSIEHGATRNFEAEKLVDEERKREEAKRLEDEANPMKMLELRTRDSKREMEMVEALDELRELNERHAALDFEEMLKERQESEEERIAREKREEDEEVMKIFNKTAIRRIQDDNDSDDEDAGHSSSSKSYAQKRSLAPSDILFTDGDNGTSTKFSAKSSKLDNKTKHKTSAAMLGIIRKPRPATAKPSSTTQVTEQHITVEKRTSADEATTAAVAGTSTGVGDGIAQEKKPVATGGLSLLGCYDTSSSSDDGGVSN